MIRLVEIAAYLKSPIEYEGPVDLDSLFIRGVTSIQRAQEGELSFLGSSQFKQHLPNCTASALISPQAFEEFTGPYVIHKDPHFAYAKVAALFFKPSHGRSGIHPQDIIEPGVHLGKDITVGAGAYIAAGARIEDGVVIYPQVYIGEGVVVGAESVLHPQVVVYQGCILGKRCLLHSGTVIGADGFGFAVSNQEICKIPQTGIVRIGDDVECGAHVTIDRAAHYETIIGDGCKFDDKVHIGHNVEIGSNCMFAAYSGVAGSTKIGSWVAMGGHTGIAGHLEITSGTQIGAKSGVIDSIRERGTYIGFPAEPAAEWRRSVAYTKRLREAFGTIRELERRLEKLETLAGKEAE